MSDCSLDRLVDDILIQIFQLLSVPTLLSLRQTSQRYYALSQLRCVWHARFRIEVLQQNLPFPGPIRPLSTLSATDLQRRTLRALHLNRAWPRLSAKTVVSTHPNDTHTRMDEVVFMSGGTEILAVQGDKITHWLVLDQARSPPRLEHVGEWTPASGVPCHVVKDDDMPGIVAIGPREPWRSHRFAKVVSMQARPFVTLSDYARVPGVVVGVWRHLLVLDTTKEDQVGAGGVAVLDWRAQTTGTVVFPRLPDFGGFLDFVVFSDHFLVVWEHCVSVYPIPCVPVDGQVFVEPKRVFMFQEAICRPVGFTTCVARRVVDADVGSEKHTQCPSPIQGATLTIAARSRRCAEVSMVMLVPLVDETGRDKKTVDDATAFPYRMTYLPSVHRTDAPRACMALRLGPSGRGICVVGRELRLFGPGVLILPPYDMQMGPILETESVYVFDRSEVGSEGDRVDFDEGTGRFVVVNARGGFDVLQLD